MSQPDTCPVVIEHASWKSRLLRHRQPIVAEIKPLALSTVQLLALLANEIRLEILTHLGRSEKPVSTIAEEMGLESSTISHALRELRKGDLVWHRVVKKQHIYQLTNAVKIRFHGSAIHVEVMTRGGKITIETRQH